MGGDQENSSVCNRKRHQFCIVYKPPIPHGFLSGRQANYGKLVAIGEYIWGNWIFQFFHEIKVSSFGKTELSLVRL